MGISLPKGLSFHSTPSLSTLTGSVVNKRKQRLLISIELSRVLIVLFQGRLYLMDTIEHVSRRQCVFFIENGTNILFDAFNGQNAFRTVCFICTFSVVFFHGQRNFVDSDKRGNCSWLEFWLFSRTFNAVEEKVFIHSNRTTVQCVMF